SHAQLVGLLPRSLENTIDFDVGVAIVAGPAGEPLIDVHPVAHCTDETLERIRAHALAVFRLIAGGSWNDHDFAAATRSSPLRSVLHAPLSSEGRIVVLTYLGSFQPAAFSAKHDQVLAELALH